jgi:hypothetical protein
VLPERAGRALVVSLTDFAYQLKVEGMLLKALELRGLRPTVLTNRSAEAQARRYFAAFGVEDVLVLEDWIGGDEEPIREATERFFDAPPTVQRLKSFEVRGAHVGRQVLSSISRSLYKGSVELDDPEARAILETLLPRSIAVLYAAERLLADLEPELVLFNEARYAGYGSIFDAALADDLNVVQFLHAFSDDGLVFRRYTTESRNVHPRSLAPETWEEVRAGPWTEAMDVELDRQFALRYSGTDFLSRRLHSWTHERSAEQLVRELALDPAKKTAVVFSHVLWDANLFYGEDLFEDQEEWLVETIREAYGNPAVNWVVKLHPANVWKRRREGVTGELSEVAAIREKVGPLPGHVRLLLPDTDVSTRSLFELADWALTIRGTIGIEAPCFGIPVVTAGSGHYSGRGFTVDFASQEEYRSGLHSIQEIPPLTAEQTELARKHAHALFCRRPVRFTSFRTTMMPLERTGHPLDHDLEVCIDSWDELVAADDLRRFAEWAVDREQVDYLEPHPAATPETVRA